MRVAPLAFLVSLDDAADRSLVFDFCRITHHSDEAYSAAIAVLGAVQGACGDQHGTELLTRVLRQIPDSNTRDRLTELVRVPPDRIEAALEITGSTGYAASVVPLALWFAAHGDSLGSMLTAVVRCGGDTDTVASIAGQVLGAGLGEGALPEQLTTGVEDLDRVRQVAAEFASFAAREA